MATVGPAGASDLAPVRPGEDQDWPALEAYLHANLEDPDGPMEVLQFPHGSANLTYMVRFGDRRYVVRRPPFGGLAPGAHDMRREHRALSRLWRTFPPAPRSYLFCDDHSVIGSDFLVIEYRRGEVIWARIPDSMSHHPDVARRVGFAVADALADLHLLDPEEAGVADLGRPDGFVARQLSGWRKRWELSAGEDANAVMVEVADRLAARVPEPQSASVLHNDFKLDNCQFDPGDPGRVHSIFDWDMATVGDPLIDLGTLLNYWPDPSDPAEGGPIINTGMETLGLPNRAEVVERYAARTGFDPAPVAWYEAFACWKTAVVLRQLYVRYERGESTDPRMATRGPLVLPQARRAQTVLDASGF
jgi:aminoglycoside phosphotransferase (APT) family kinase protein